MPIVNDPGAMFRPLYQGPTAFYIGRQEARRANAALEAGVERQQNQRFADQVGGGIGQGLSAAFNIPLMGAVAKGFDIPNEYIMGGLLSRYGVPGAAEYYGSQISQRDRLANRSIDKYGMADAEVIDLGKNTFESLPANVQGDELGKYGFTTQQFSALPADRKGTIYRQMGGDVVQLQQMDMLSKANGMREEAIQTAKNEADAAAAFQQGFGERFTPTNPKDIRDLREMDEAEQAVYAEPVSPFVQQKMLSKINADRALKIQGIRKSKAYTTNRTPQEEFARNTFKDGGRRYQQTTRNGVTKFEEMGFALDTPEEVESHIRKYAPGYDPSIHSATISPENGTVSLHEKKSDAGGIDIDKIIATVTKPELGYDTLTGDALSNRVAEVASAGMAVRRQLASQATLDVVIKQGISNPQQIQTAKDLIVEGYPDISKSPPRVQRFATELESAERQIVEAQTAVLTAQAIGSMPSEAVEANLNDITSNFSPDPSKIPPGVLNMARMLRARQEALRHAGNSR